MVHANPKTEFLYLALRSYIAKDLMRCLYSRIFLKLKVQTLVHLVHKILINLV